MTARKVLVTGANSGLGLATALHAAAAGHRVIGTVRSEAKSDVLLRAAAEASVEVASTLLDVTDADRGQEVIDEIRPDVVVNNAGYAMSAPMETVPDQDATQLLDTMLIAPMRLARLAVPHMRDRGWGRIVNVSSIMGRVSMPLTGWYQAAKHGLEAASDSLRMELARDGIAVVLIEPGMFATSIFDDLAADQDRYGTPRYDGVYDRMRDALRRSEPIMGDPEEVGRAVVRVIAAGRPRARYLVGADAQLLDATRTLAPPMIQDPIRDRIQRFVAGL
ncbi:MAG: SDR family NAD(P)-dependent oxidoreductase [Acidimicrobiales bacterium]